MAASFPSSIKSFTDKVDNVDTVMAADINSGYDEIEAIETTLGTLYRNSWIPANATWAYASASTFTVAGNYTAYFARGTRLKWTQTTVKYGVVVSSSYSAPNTTVTIAVNTDYVITDAAISDNYYSYSNPPDFPCWFNYSPTLAGFSSNPTNTVNRFKVDGNTVTVCISQGTSGTSSGTGFTATLPITAKTITNMIWQGANGYAADNSADLTGASMWSIASAGTTVAFYTNMAAAAWTASGGKRVRSIFTYEI